MYALNCIKIGTAIELACGYGGSVGAMKAMGGDVLNLSDAELKQIVTDWRNASPHIVKFWWAVDDAVKTAIRRKTTTETHGLQFRYQSGMLFITLPSSRNLCYAHPQIWREPVRRRICDVYGDSSRISCRQSPVI